MLPFAPNDARAHLEGDELAKGRNDRHRERVDAELSDENRDPRVVKGAHALVVPLEVGLRDPPRPLVAVAAKDRARDFEHLDRGGEAAAKGTSAIDSRRA